MSHSLQSVKTITSHALWHIRETWRQTSKFIFLASLRNKRLLARYSRLLVKRPSNKISMKVGAPGLIILAVAAYETNKAMKRSSYHFDIFFNN